MASYKVTYFDGRGGGEIIRLTLSAAGQTFEDERIQRENWPALKPSKSFFAIYNFIAFILETLTI